MSYGNYAPFYRGGYFNPMQPPMPMDTMQYAPQAPQMPQSAPQIPITAPSADPFIWVLGQVEAESYPVAPGNTVIMWDKNAPVIYVKSVNEARTPSFRIFDFTERPQSTSQPPQNHVCTCGKDFAKIEAFDALKGEFDKLSSKFDELISKPENTPKTKAKVKEESEDA